MAHPIVQFLKVIFRPIYDVLAKPLHRRVLQQVEAEIQQIHQHYLAFHAEYHQKVSDELVSLHKRIEELQRDRLVENRSKEHEQ